MELMVFPETTASFATFLSERYVSSAWVFQGAEKIKNIPLKIIFPTQNTPMKMKAVIANVLENFPDRKAFSNSSVSIPACK